jgi:hypothetical protein
MYTGAILYCLVWLTTVVLPHLGIIDGSFGPSRRKGKRSEGQVLALCNAGTKSPCCTASFATPHAGSNPPQTVRSWARTAAQINVQPVVPIDEFLHVPVALWHGPHSGLAPTVRSVYLDGGMGTMSQGAILAPAQLQGAYDREA